MHEYGLAQDVVDSLRAEMEQAGGRRIIAVDIEVGGLSHVSAERLALWVGEALQGGPGQDATVRVERASSILFCQDCRERSPRPPPPDGEWDASSLLASCPRCGSARVTVEGDMGCTIRHLELER